MVLPSLARLIESATYVLNVAFEVDNPVDMTKHDGANVLLYLVCLTSILYYFQKTMIPLI
jgi:hypothetical protein